MEKIRQRIREHAPCILAVLLTVVLYFVVYAIFNIFPFGKGTFSRYDGIHQVDPFLKHLSNVFYGKDSFLFSFQIGGGLDMIGSLIYICFSPFTILYMIFGWGNIHYVTNFVIILKSIAMVIAFYYMIRKVYPNLTNKKLQFLLLISYLTCGYFCANHTWYSWIDYLIYLPLLVVAFRHMIVRHKIAPFTIMLCFMVAVSVTLSIQCYIIGIILLFLYPIMVLEQKERGIALKNIILSSLLAIVIMFPFMLTMLQVVGDTTRLTTGLSFGGKVYLPAYFSKYAYLLLDTILLGVALCGAFGKNKTEKDKYYIGAIVISLLPIVVDQIAVLLSFGKYFGYFYRFAFLYQIILFCFVCNLLEKKCQEGTTFQSKPQKEHKWQYVFLSISLVVSIISVLLILQDRYFSSAQANGVIVACLLLIFWPVLLFVIFLWRGVSGGKITKRMLTSFLTCFYVIQLFLFGSSIVGVGSYDLSTYALYEDILEEYQLHGKRVKWNGSFDTLMMGTTLGYVDNEAFTSSLQGDNLVHSKALSFDNNKVNCIKSSGGTILSDCIMGYDYIVTDIPSKLPYLELLGQKEDYYIYHNTLSLSGGFGIENNVITINDDMYITSKQNELYRFLGGEGILASNTTLYDYLPDYLYQVRGDSYDFIIPKENREIEGITLSVKGGYQYYITGKFQDVFASYTLNGNTYDMRSENMIDLGYMQEDHVISLDLIIEEYTEYTIYNNYYLEILSLDVNKMTETLTNVVQTTGNIKTDKCKLEYAFESDYAYYVLPYVYHDGYDGGVFTNDLGLILTSEKSGTITYHSPYVKKLIMMILGAIVIATLLIIAIKLGWFRWLEKCSLVLASIYAAVVLCILCFAGLGLEMMSWIKLIF